MVRRAVVQDTDMGFDRILEDLKKLGGYSILTGIQESAKTGAIVKGDRKLKAGQSIAQYAAENEFGTRKIPERSFMRSSFDENVNKIANAANNQIALVIVGKKSINQALHVLEIALQQMVQNKIRAIQTPPNSPVTIAIKGSSKPLIDFGNMIASVRSITRRRAR